MRNLEEEYKKSQYEKTPDLWGKIEAGLPEKRKFPGKKRLIRYMGLAAAALFLCVLIPVFLNMGSRDMTNESQSYDSAMPMDETDNAASHPREDNKAAQDSTEQETSFGSEQIESDQDNPGWETENSMLQDSASMEDMVSCIVRETLEVSGSAQQGGCTVYTLSASKGQTYRAVFLEGTEQELLTGESYVFTLNEVDAEEWEYVIQAVE